MRAGHSTHCDICVLEVCVCVFDEKKYWKKKLKKKKKMKKKNEEKKLSKKSKNPKLQKWEEQRKSEGRCVRVCLSLSLYVSVLCLYLSPAARLFAGVCVCIINLSK